jgi:hypothetical protein
MNPDIYRLVTVLMEEIQELRLRVEALEMINENIQTEQCDCIGFHTGECVERK